MPPSRERSPAPDATNLKRLKTTHLSPSNAPSPPAAAPHSSPFSADLTSQFIHEVFNHNYIADLHSVYLNSAPFKHAVVEKLFQDELLGRVKDECLRLNFTEKETDIFKVRLSFFFLWLLLENGSPYSFNRSSRLAILPLWTIYLSLRYHSWPTSAPYEMRCTRLSSVSLFAL